MIMIMFSVLLLLYCIYVYSKNLYLCICISLGIIIEDIAKNSKKSFFYQRKHVLKKSQTKYFKRVEK